MTSDLVTVQRCMKFVAQQTPPPPRESLWELRRQCSTAERCVLRYSRVAPITMTFIGPSLLFIEGDNTINHNSIAFILQYKQFRRLFTGDAGVRAKQRFLN